MSKIAILGYSKLEQSESIDAYNYYEARGDDVTIYYWEGITIASDLPTDVTVRLCPNEQTFEGLDEFDLIVRGSGIHPRFVKTSKPVTTVYNEFMSQCPAPIIGVTGTKGKGTTSTLIAKILEASGKKVILAGNIGRPPLGLLPDVTPDSFVVLELSSFQLMDIKYSPHIGVCLMVVPEHMNWHADMDEYLHAKSNMFAFQKPDDIAVYNLLCKNSKFIASSSAGHKSGYAVPDVNEVPPADSVAYVEGDTIYCNKQPICKINEVGLLGRHNLKNVCAAITATWELVKGDIETINTVIKSFKGLEHRLEFVRELDGVKYYDDSFSTTPETAIAALRSFEQPVVMILGGADKEIPFDTLAEEVVTRKPKHVLAIGQTGPTIAKLLQNKGYSSVTTEDLDTMNKIVEAAKKESAPGDVVLLSTGCASFGMFEDYKDRGNQFKKAVLELS